MKRFEGKTAVVTGGAGGIGAAICRRLASEGAFVCVVDSDATAAEALAAAIRADGGEATHDRVDLGEPAQIEHFVQKAVARHGRIDILCNNAGVNRRGALIEITGAQAVG